MAEPLLDIPRGNRILYASASFGGNVLSRALALWLIFFYDPTGPGNEIVPRLILVSILGGIGALDALWDPFVGHWSDRTRSRWGRRIPFVVLATPFYTLFFFLLWTPPGEGRSVLINATYFAIVVALQRIAGVLSGGPLESLLPEIARSAVARVSIVSYQFLFGALGAVIGLVVSGIIQDIFGFAVMAAIIALIAFFSRYISLAGAWRYARVDVEPVRVNFLTAVRHTLRNDQFLYFLPTFVLFNMAVTLLTAILPFYAEAVVLKEEPLPLTAAGPTPDAIVEGRLGEEEVRLNLLGLSLRLEEGAVTAILTATAIGVVILAVPVIYRLALRRGKAWVYSTAMGLGALIYPFLFFMGFIPGIPVLGQSLIFVALFGLPMAGVFVFPNAIMADIIDYDALRTGMRREAMYYGTQNTVEKWMSSLAPPILGGLLLIGETAANPMGIRLAGPVAGAAALIGFLFFRGYSLPDTVTAETVPLKKRAPQPAPRELT